MIWQYTAIDVASAYTWAFLRSPDHNPTDRHAAELLHLVAKELKAADWEARRGHDRQRLGVPRQGLHQGLARHKATRRKIKAGRPNSNDCVERVQLTILEECWRPTFSRSLALRISALRRDLDEYLRYYNADRAHIGRLTKEGCWRISSSAPASWRA